ncbi:MULTISPECIES: hypothetical protein [Microbacterium]|uniref:hypothetical protein n=1 Tax=Microbacterium TaxID=33882 RepID=UPI00344B191F
MKADELFLQADAALRSVIDRIDPADLSKPAPQEWTSTPDPTFRDILFAHAYDEAWVPDVLAGKSVADGDEFRDADLLGDDPIASYDRLNDTATAAVRDGAEPGTVFRFQYGDYPADEGYAHLATYRAFQAWLIAKRLGIPFHLSPELIAVERARRAARRRVASVGCVPAGDRTARGCRRRNAAAVRGGVLGGLILSARARRARCRPGRETMRSPGRPSRA